MNMRLVCLVSAILTAGAAAQHADACWCSPLLMWCVGQDWQQQPGTVNTTTTEQTLREDANSNGPCTTSGATAPTQICKADFPATGELTWEVTGTVHYEIFNVNAQTGGTITIGPFNDSGTTITQWCECCRRRSYVKFNVTTCVAVCGPCTNIYGVTCQSTDPNAMYTQYAGWFTENKSCTPPSGCSPPPDPPCPQAG